MLGPQLQRLLFNTATSSFIDLSIFLAFAYLYPDYEIRIFMIIPVKVNTWAGFHGHIFFSAYSISLDWKAVCDYTHTEFLPVLRKGYLHKVQDPGQFYLQKEKVSGRIPEKAVCSQMHCMRYYGKRQPGYGFQVLPELSRKFRVLHGSPKES